MSRLDHRPPYTNADRVADVAGLILIFSLIFFLAFVLLDRQSEPPSASLSVEEPRPTETYQSPRIAGHAAARARRDAAQHQADNLDLPASVNHAGEAESLAARGRVAQAMRDQRAAEVRAAEAEATRRAVVASAPKPTPTGSSSGGGDWPAIAACIRQIESGGNYAAVNPSGKYRGAYQFDQRTWESVGGVGDPAAASPAEQDARAYALWQARGLQPWPTPRVRC